MLVIPAISGDKSLLVVIIEPENLDRMKQGDPITLNTAEGGFIKGLNPNNTELVIAYTDDPAPLYEMAKKSDLKGILAHISKGYKFHPGVDGVKIESLKGQMS